MSMKTICRHHNGYYLCTCSFSLVFRFQQVALRNVEMLTQGTNSFFEFECFPLLDVIILCHYLNWLSVSTRSKCFFPFFWWTRAVYTLFTRTNVFLNCNTPIVIVHCSDWERVNWIGEPAYNDVRVVRFSVKHKCANYKYIQICVRRFFCFGFAFFVLLLRCCPHVRVLGLFAVSLALSSFFCLILNNLRGRRKLQVHTMYYCSEYSVFYFLFGFSYSIGPIWECAYSFNLPIYIFIYVDSWSSAVRDDEHLVQIVIKFFVAVACGV